MKYIVVLVYVFLLEGVILLLNLLLFAVNGLKMQSLGAAFNNSWKYLVALGLLIFLGTVFNAISYNYFGVATLNIVGKVGMVVQLRMP